MNCCCTNSDPPAPMRRGSRFTMFIQWALPITALALIPKCPGCVAAYVLLFSGVGLSIPTAAAMRSVLITLSVAALAYLLLRAARRALTRHRVIRTS